MIKTRKKAREDAAQEAEMAEAGTSQQQQSNTLQVPVPEDVDLDYLTEILPTIPDFSRVTPDVVSMLYKLVASLNTDLDGLRREVDELNGEVERKDVELDQALQDKERLGRELEENVESVHSELEQVKQERARLAEENNALKSKVAQLSNSQTSSSSEAETLKHRLDDSEREKRDLLVVISRLKEESSQREEEIQTLRANLKEARQEHQTLESQVRELKSAETSTKFKIDTLTQQLQLAQAEAERSSAELIAKAEEYSKYRRTKHSEMLQLQSAYDSLTQEHATTKATLQTLQSAHSAQTNQLTQALSKIQALQGQLAEQESKYASEANGLKRLIEMMEEREKQAKEIVDSIEKEWSTVGEKTERRENALKQEIERERQAREEAERRADHLETVVHRMGRGELPLPGTPFRTPGGVDRSEDGIMGLSPTVALASRSQKSGKTFTQVYQDYVRLEEEYNRKCVEHEQMEKTLSTVLAEIEERAPILSNQRKEYDRIVDEASHLSNQLAIAIEERDSQAKLAEDQTQKLKALNKENGLLQKQLNDLGRQVQHLLREIARRDDPTLPADDEMEELPVPAASVDEVITSHLVLFRNIEGLQQQNQKLLKVTRDLGEKMEQEEREYKEKLDIEQNEAIREAHQVLQDLSQQMDEQKRQSDALIQSYVKERDTLKLMLSRANAGRGPTNAMAVEPANESELAKELEEVQSQFEAYKMEIGLDSTRLREKLIAAERESHELNAALAKANAKVEFLNDRLRIHQEDFQIRDRQLDEMSKRNQQLFDQYTRVDIECNRVTEELHVSNGRLEQLRNECANLRAEKNIWEGVQARLVEENRALSVERSHLASLMTNIQRMHGDLERSGENDRRRLEGQLQMLESQTQDLRTQLSRERDTVRHLTLQKELEAKELQTRLDKANEEAAKTREALISAETSKKHLEERVADLTKQLQGNQEKLGVYERRPATTAAAATAATSVDPDLSREQQLEQEVAELRSALKVAEVDLSAARGHVQQFKDISQANEVALSSLNATFDEYKASTEAQLAHRESEFKALEERLAATTAELTQLREQHAALQKTFDEERTSWKNDKKTLEDTIVDMTTSDKHSEADRSSREEEIRIAEERVKAAEERYSSEVMAHAETFKAIEQLKKDLNAAQNRARENQSAAETAQAKLVASENSWKSQKETLDKEISDLKTRVQDLTSQNAILHQHLESVSSQASRIRATAEGSTATTGEGDSGDADAKLSELRSVVSYLRKEKEIVDLQLELSKQEAARLKAQVDHLTTSLQETRNALTEERERAVESAASAAQHAELLERINQLNILRESNATLRAESENHAKKARQLEVKLRGLSAQLQPAQEQARTAQAELEVARGTIQRLEQECQSWQDRNRQLLSKYDRVDPVELQNLKDEVAKLKAEVEEARTAQKAAEEELAKKQAEFQDQTKVLQLAERNHARAKESIAKANVNWREKLGAMNEERKAFAEEKERLNAKIAELEASVTVASSAVPQPGDFAEQLQAKEAQIAALQAEKEKLVAEKEALSKSITAQPAAAGGEVPASWEAEKAELLKAQEETAQKLKELEEQAGKVANLKLHNEKITARMASLAKQLSEEKQKHQAALAQAKAEAAASAGAGTAAPSEELTKNHSEEIENLKKQHVAEMQRLQATVAELQAAVQKAKQEAAAASHAGSNSQSSAQADARVKELEAELAKVKEEQQAAIVKAMEDGRQEVGLKMRVKENQLTKYTKRCKELEQRITEWESNGTLPAGSLATVGPTATALPAQVKPAAAAGTAGAKPTPATQPKPAAAAGQPKPATAGPSTGAATTGALPRKPSVAGAPAANTTAARGAAPPARGRGAARGGARGTANRVLPTRQTTPLSGGVSIMGAAAAAAASAGGAAPKRPREEGDAGAGEDSLAKRLKPAEGAAPAGSKPVQLRRPAPNP